VDGSVRLGRTATAEKGFGTVNGEEQRPTTRISTPQPKKELSFAVADSLSRQEERSARSASIRLIRVEAVAVVVPVRRRRAMLT
jgi:hypothetical protein